MNDFDRRKFLTGVCALPIALELSGGVTRAEETTTEKTETGIEDLLAYADPILLPSTPELPEHRNAYPLLRQAVKSLTLELKLNFHSEFEWADCFLSPSPDLKNEERLSAWIDSNSAAIELVEKAVRCGELAWPRSEWESSDRFDELGDYRRLCRLLLLAAQRCLAEGNPTAAVQICQTTASAFHLLRDGGGVYIEHLMGGACEAEAWKLMRRIGGHAKADSESIRMLLAGMSSEWDEKLGARRSLQVEYCDFLLPELDKLRTCDPERFWERVIPDDLIMSREKHEAARQMLVRIFEGHPQMFDAVDTAKRGSTRYAEMIRDLELPWVEHRDRPEPAASKELTAWPAKLGLGVMEIALADEVSSVEVSQAREQLRGVTNPVGRKLLEDSMLSSKLIHRTALIAKTRFEGTKLYLAICLHAREHRELPKDLDVLVESKLLGELPVDPFSDRKPFGYSREDGLLWSVGWSGLVGPGGVDTGPLDPESDDAADFEYHRWNVEIAGIDVSRAGAEK